MPIPDFDFSSIFGLHVLVELALFDPQFPEEIGFQMDLNRIRVGALVPETSAAIDVGLLMFISCAVWSRFSFWKREWNHDKAFNIRNGVADVHHYVPYCER
jgi:hypothetical protein